MNAKKIMGAVLVALLAAALFVGAGAAADTTDIGVITAYTPLTSVTVTSGTFTFSVGQSFAAVDGTTAVTVMEDGTGTKYIKAGAEQLNKQYTGYGITFKLVAPTAVVVAIDSVTGANIIGETVSAAVANKADFQVVGDSSVSVVFIDEDGVRYNGVSWDKDFTAGVWGVAANLTGKTGLDSEISVQGAIYSFTVTKADGTISAVKDTVNIGNTIVIKVYYPGYENATVEYSNGYVDLIDDQEDVLEKDETAGWVKIRLASDGTMTIAFTAEETGDAEFILVDAAGDEIASVTVTVEKGVLTAKADADSFFVGNPIYISGTSTAGKDLYFYIEGQNFLFTDITGAIVDDIEWDGENWNVEFDYSKISDHNGKTLVAGTYPVIVSLSDGDGLTSTDVTSAAALKRKVMEATYASATVTLTQPFITDVKAPAVVVQEDEYKITGTAYAADEVRLYIFGTNYFAQMSDATTDEEFEFVLTPGITSDMAVGTYFYLIQHPMKDELFNVWTNESAKLGETTFGDFYYAATGVFKPLDDNAASNLDATFIFNAFKRGTNFAAQALLEEIAGQNIDDIFVQGTFEVEAQKLVINPIPAEVAKGTALTISGYTNSGAGTEVIVNVLSGKFGATVKGDENAALFLTAKAVSKEDGTFEAAIDTSKLELGNYVVTVEIDGTQYDSAAVAIVAASEPVTPPADDEPVTPPADDEPVVPETPGFGALAALAGLGAVAVLLLRRE